jgi:hypothetical protein
MRKEVDSSRLNDEVSWIRSQLGIYTLERRKDVEETADFIKRIVEQQKCDWGLALNGAKTELYESLKRQNEQFESDTKRILR